MADQEEVKKDKDGNEIVRISQLSDDTKIGGRSDWGNKLVVNTGTNPVINFAFMLRVEGVFDLPCKTVRNIRRENEFDYIQEGGLNDYVHLKRKSISKPFTFEVERYVGVNWVDPLPLGTELLLPVILFVNKGCFPKLNPVRTYTFTGCTVISKDYGELNAEASGLLVERVTIAYREMVCLDIPSDTLETDDVWKFKGTEREGSGTRRYNTNLFNSDWETKYNSKAQREKRARLWPEKNSAKREEMKTPEAQRWTPRKNAEDGKWENDFGRNYEDYAADYNAAIQKAIDNAKTPEEKKAAKELKKIVMNSAASRLWPEQNSAKRKEMKTPANRKYEHTAEAKKYNSAKHHENEKSRKQHEENARLWPKKKSAKQITDFLKNQ